MSPSIKTMGREQKEPTFTFGPFHLIPAEMLLLEDGTPVELGSRTLDILIALAQRAGQLVSKEDLIAAAWPNTVVEGANLRVHVSALRKALGDGRDGRRYILTVPGRGYRFVGLSAPSNVEPSSASRLPPAPARLIGRDDMVQTVTTQLRQRRFVTLVGPGGIGKTAMALDIAHRLGPGFDDGICFVDLSNAISGEAAVSAIGLALGLALYSNETAVGVLAALRAKRLLLVLDSCERVVDHVGALLERLLKEAQGVHVLATSREPLHAEGERVLRLPPLELPPPSAGLTAAEIGTYPAVQLFVERAVAALGDLKITDADASVIAAICSRLDGIALAIELVAGQVGAFDLPTLNALLNDR